MTCVIVRYLDEGFEVLNNIYLQGYNCMTHMHFDDTSIQQYFEQRAYINVKGSVCGSWVPLIVCSWANLDEDCRRVQKDYLPRAGLEPAPRSSTCKSNSESTKLSGKSMHFVRIHKIYHDLSKARLSMTC